MSEYFQLFRLAVIPRQHFDMFAGERLTREQTLRRAFNREYVYKYNGIDYHYVPGDNLGSELIIGRIGRQYTLDENKPPSEGFQETQRTTWKAAYIVVDPFDHSDGQKAAVEIDFQVGGASALLLGLLREINRLRVDQHYTIEAAPIVNTSSFWEFAAQNKGSVTSIKFEFVVPNMFGTKDQLNDDLRSLRDREKAKRVSVTLHSPEGLNTDTERTRESVEYIDRAGGVIRAKAKGRKTYLSTEQEKRTRVPGDADDGEEPFARIRRLALKIVGRE